MAQFPEDTRIKCDTPSLALGRPLEESPKESPGAGGPTSVLNSLGRVSGVSKKTVFRVRRLFGECLVGGGKRTIKPLPKKQFWTRHYSTISPPPLLMPCHFPWREQTQTRPIPLSEPSKTFGGCALQYVSPPPPPQSRTIRFAPPFVIRYCFFPHFKWGCKLISVKAEEALIHCSARP